MSGPYQENHSISSHCNLSHLEILPIEETLILCRCVAGPHATRIIVLDRNLEFEIVFGEGGNVYVVLIAFEPLDDERRLWSMIISLRVSYVQDRAYVF